MKINDASPEEKTFFKSERQTKILDAQKDKSALEQQLDSYHFAIHTHETKTDELLVTVRSKLTHSSKAYFKKTDKKNRDIIFKIRISDYKKVYGSNFDHLYAYLEKAVKTIISIGFDETLTIDHTHPDEIANKKITPRTPKNNMRFETQTKSALEALSKKNNILLIIVSPNAEDRISDHIKIWYPEGNDPFKGKIYGQETSTVTSSLFKIAEMQAFNFQVRTHKPETKKYGFNPIVEHEDPDETDSNRCYLTLGLENPILFVVRCLFVDHNTDTLSSCAEQGIDTLTVDAENNSHLLTLNKQFNLGIKLQPQKLNKSIKSDSSSGMSFTPQTAEEYAAWAAEQGLPSSSESPRFGRRLFP